MDKQRKNMEIQLNNGKSRQNGIDCGFHVRI